MQYLFFFIVGSLYSMWLLFKMVYLNYMYIGGFRHLVDRRPLEIRKVTIKKKVVENIHQYEKHCVRP